MEAGRELDARIAERVMGWEVVTLGFGPRNGERVFVHPSHRPALGLGDDQPDLYAPLPTYSTDIAAAWEVVEKLGILHGAFTLIQHPDSQPFPALTGKWHSGFGKFVGEADTAPHAICLAALKAVSSSSPPADPTPT